MKTHQPSYMIPARHFTHPLSKLQVQATYWRQFFWNKTYSPAPYEVMPIFLLLSIFRQIKVGVCDLYGEMHYFYLNIYQTVFGGWSPSGHRKKDTESEHNGKILHLPLYTGLIRQKLDVLAWSHWLQTDKLQQKRTQMIRHMQSKSFTKSSESVQPQPYDIFYQFIIHNYNIIVSNSATLAAFRIKRSEQSSHVKD